jgi:N-carbamoylputrescine amidase
LIEGAAQDGAQLAVLPEMSLFPFFPRVPHRYEFFELAEPIPGPTFNRFSELAKANKVHIVYNHYERSPDHLFFDTSVVVGPEGEFIGRQRMMHIAEEPGYNEKFYYAPGQDAYHVFDVEGWRFGIATCYDRHYPEVFRSFILQGADLVLVPTAVANSEPFGDTYELEIRAAAVTHGVYVAVANRAGKEDPLEFLGRSMLVDPQGRIVNALDAESNQVSVVEVSKEEVTQARILFPFLRDRRPETYDIV